MKINLVDRSQYFKGLLLLVGKDQIISDEEKELLFEYGSQLGFEKIFIENSFTSLLSNEYIIDKPPKFTSMEVTESFIKEGFRIALSDNDLDENELEFLKETAKFNGINEEEFQTLQKSYVSSYSGNIPSTKFEVDTNSF